jgi:hypothetical protein
MSQQTVSDENGSISYARYPVKANFASLEEAIAAGGYDYAHPDITAENFRIHPGNIVIDAEFALYPLQREDTSDRLIHELGSQKLRPVTLLEILAFGTKHPDVQREHSIVALGSSFMHPSGRLVVPCLSAVDDERVLVLRRWHGSWTSNYCFLSVDT